MDIVGMLKGLFDAVSGVFGLARDRSKLHNAEDVRKAKIGQDEINAQNKTEEAIRKRDLEQLRKDLAE